VQPALSDIFNDTQHRAVWSLLLSDECVVCCVREYYFSTENLVKDFFLRRQMDTDGWIAVELLASFRRVRIHTGSVNTQIIVDVCAFSVCLTELTEFYKCYQNLDNFPTSESVGCTETVFG